jgi:hypothetical protein
MNVTKAGEVEQHSATEQIDASFNGSGHIIRISKTFEGKTNIADSRKPEMNIEMLPTQLFFSLNGSFTEPYFLPTMSANPAS